MRLWARDADVAAALRSTRHHPWALPGIELDERVRVEEHLDAALDGAAVAILAVPSHGMRDIATAAARSAARTSSW